MIEPIDTTTSSLPPDVVRELAFQRSNIAAARTEDTVSLSHTAQATIRADEVRAENTKAVTQSEIQREESAARAIQDDQLRATENAAAQAADQPLKQSNAAGTA